MINHTYDYLKQYCLLAQEVAVINMLYVNIFVMFQEKITVWGKDLSIISFCQFHYYWRNFKPNNEETCTKELS